MRKNTLYLIIILLIFGSAVLYTAPKKEKNSKDDAIPAVIDNEYKKLTLDIMKVLDFYDGYKMVENNILTRMRLYRPDMSDALLDSLINTSSETTYLDSLVIVYSKYFSLNDVKNLHKYFFSKTFKKADRVASKIQSEINEILNNLDAQRKKQMKEVFIKTEQKIPEFLEKQY